MKHSLPFLLSLALMAPALGLSACGDEEGASHEEEQVDAGIQEPTSDAAIVDPTDASEEEPTDASEEEPIDAGEDRPDGGEVQCLPACGEGQSDKNTCITFDVEVTNTWPTEGATNIPVTAGISITFNQGMFPNSLTASNDPSSTKEYNAYLTKRDSTEVVPVVRKYSTDKTAFVYTPSRALEPNTAYAMHIKGGGCTNGTNEAARSQMDTKMAEDFVLNFTTGSEDLVAQELLVTSVIPSDGATEVSPSASVKVTFNQPIQASTLFTVPDGQGASPKDQGTFYVSTNSGYIWPEAGSLTIAADLLSATFVPDRPLSGNKTYYVGVKGCDDLAQPNTGKCLRALSGGRLGEDFGASFSVQAPVEGTISSLISAANALTDNDQRALVNVTIPEAIMTYYRDVKDNEGFFMQWPETVNGTTQQVGIFVNTKDKAPLIPVWPMFLDGKGNWNSDEIVPVPEEDLEVFATTYPHVSIDVSQVGLYDGMPYVDTDGFPAMAKKTDASGQPITSTLSEMMSSGVIPFFSQEKLQALKDANTENIHQKLIVTDDHLGTLVMLDGVLSCFEACKHMNSLNNIWFDLKWGLPFSENDPTIYDQFHKIRVLLSQDQMDWMGLQKVDGAQKHVRILAPVQKGDFQKKPLLYVKPYKISAVTCDEEGTCEVVPKTAAELDETPELVRDIAIVKPEAIPVPASAQE